MSFDAALALEGPGTYDQTTGSTMRCNDLNDTSNGFVN
jgi:hypothetical protein